MSWTNAEELRAEYKTRHDTLQDRYYKTHEIDKATFDQLHGDLGKWLEAELFKLKDPDAYEIRWSRLVREFKTLLRDHYDDAKFDKAEMQQKLKQLIEDWFTELVDAGWVTSAPTAEKNKMINKLVKCWDDYYKDGTITEDNWAAICATEQKRFYDVIKAVVNGG